MLAPDLHVTTTSTQSIVYLTDLTGIDVYMNGLIKFAQKVEPGSVRLIASVGDERNSLILLTVRTAYDGQKGRSQWRGWPSSTRTRRSRRSRSSPSWFWTDLRAGRAAMPLRPDLAWSEACKPEDTFG